MAFRDALRHMLKAALRRSDHWSGAKPREDQSMLRVGSIGADAMRSPVAEVSGVPFLTASACDPSPPLSCRMRSGGRFRDEIVRGIEMARRPHDEAPLIMRVACAALGDPAVDEARDVDMASLSPTIAPGAFRQIPAARRPASECDQRNAAS